MVSPIVTLPKDANEAAVPFSIEANEIVPVNDISVSSHVFEISFELRSAKS